MKTDDNRGNEEIAMVTKLVSNDNKSFKFALFIFLEDTKYMTILTRQERERLVLDLYNQGKTYREIAKEARVSFRDIGAILNKEVEGKKIDGGKEEQDNNGTEKTRIKNNNIHLYLLKHTNSFLIERLH